MKEKITWTVTVSNSSIRFMQETRTFMTGKYNLFSFFIYRFDNRFLLKKNNRFHFSEL